jgi:hypothetical protein
MEESVSKLARGLFRLLAILAIAGVGVSAAGLVLQARADLRHKAQKELLARANLAASIIDPAIRDDVDGVQHTIQRPGFVSQVAHRHWTLAKHYVTDLTARRRRLSTASLYDAKGVLRVRSPFASSLIGRRFTQQEYFTAALRSNAVHISKIYRVLGGRGSVVVAFSMAVRTGNGKAVGVLAGTMPVAGLDKLVQPFSGEDSVVRLYDKGQQLVEPSTEVPAQDVPADAHVKAALAGTPGVLESGNTVVAAVPMPKTSWALTLTEPTRAAYIGENDDVLHWSLLAGIATVLAALATLAIGWGIHERRHEAGSTEG